MTTHETSPGKAPEKPATAAKPPASDAPVFDPVAPATPQERMAHSIFGNHTSPQAQEYLDALHEITG
jgi:hypothetical protein